jgi:hypothetical protein
MPRVYNMRDPARPRDAVYVGRGRGSVWGNPFSHKDGTLAEHRVATVDEAISKHREWLLAQPELVEAVRRELRGRDLVCFCVPYHACHAETLLEIANAPQ